MRLDANALTAASRAVLYSAGWRAPSDAAACNCGWCARAASSRLCQSCRRCHSDKFFPVLVKSPSGDDNPYDPAAIPERGDAIIRGAIWSSTSGRWPTVATPRVSPRPALTTTPGRARPLLAYHHQPRPCVATCTGGGKRLRIAVERARMPRYQAVQSGSVGQKVRRDAGSCSHLSPPD